MLGRVCRHLAVSYIYPVPNVLTCCEDHALVMSVVCRLSDPTATLSGINQNGTSHSVLLTLSAPKADPTDKVCLDWSTFIHAFTPLPLYLGVATITFPYIMLGGRRAALFQVVSPAVRPAIVCQNSGAVWTAVSAKPFSHIKQEQSAGPT